MNDFEERLRVLLNEQVDARVDPRRPVPELAVTDAPGAGARRPRPAWLLPLLAAACVLIVGGGALGATHLLAAPERRHHTIASAPTVADNSSGSASTTPVPTPTTSRSSRAHATPSRISTVHHAGSAGRRAANPGHTVPAATRPEATPTTSTSASAAPPAPCDAANLSVTEPASTDTTAPLAFQNTGELACTLQGAPAVVLVDGSGTDGPTAIPASGDPSTVTLAPGDTATAQLQWSGTEASTGTCADFAALRVTAPGTSTAGTVTPAQAMHVCPAADGSTSLTVDAITAGPPG